MLRVQQQMMLDMQRLQRDADEGRARTMRLEHERDHIQQQLQTTCEMLEQARDAALHSAQARVPEERATHCTAAAEAAPPARTVKTEKLAQAPAPAHDDDDDDDDDPDDDDDSDDEPKTSFFDAAKRGVCKVTFFSGAEIDSFATDMSKELNREALPKLRAALEMRDDKFGHIFDVPLSVYKKAIRTDAEARAYDGFIFRTCQAARKNKGVHLTIFESEERELMRTDPIEYKMGRMLYERMRGFHTRGDSPKKRLLELMESVIGK